MEDQGAGQRQDDLAQIAQARRLGRGRLRRDHAVRILWFVHGVSPVVATRARTSRIRFSKESVSSLAAYSPMYRA